MLALASMIPECPIIRRACSIGMPVNGTLRVVRVVADYRVTITAPADDRRCMLHLHKSINLQQNTGIRIMLQRLRGLSPGESILIKL